jgi:hypothetical protein
MAWCSVKKKHRDNFTFYLYKFKRMFSKSWATYVTLPATGPTAFCLQAKTVSIRKSRNIAQVVRRRLVTVEPTVRVQDIPCGICGGQSNSSTGFLIVLCFPSTSHHSNTVPCYSIIALKASDGPHQPARFMTSLG